MELIYYVGSSFPIKLAIFFLLIRQISFILFLIFKCIVRTKIILESSPKLFIFREYKELSDVWSGHLSQRQMRLTHCYLNHQGVPTALWISFKHYGSQLPSPQLVPLFCFLFHHHFSLGFGWVDLFPNYPNVLHCLFPLGICICLPCLEHFSSIFAWLIPHL